MRHLYTLIFYLALPIIFLRLLWKARKNPNYAKGLSERLGIINVEIPKGGLWIHAVSVGESIAAIPLIKTIKQRHPNLPVIVTNETPTGAACIRSGLGDAVLQFYAPYDVPCAVNKFLKKVQPSLLVLMETELWPNILHYCEQQKIPIVLINARLSERSAKGYQRIRQLIFSMLQSLTKIAAQTQADAERFIALGLPNERAVVTGSIKFDLDIPADLLERAKSLRQQWSGDRLIWIAASTHEGEEEKLVAVFTELRKKFPQLLLVSVPRHPDRCKQVADLYRRQGYNLMLRSENKSCTAETDIFIGDTMGELLLFYAVADVAFVGGSLVEKGGQNPLEPAALGLPVVVGPHTFNFAVITEQLKKSNAEIQVENMQQLTVQVAELLSDAQKRKQMGERGREFVKQNRGALARQLELIEKFLCL